MATAEKGVNPVRCFGHGTRQIVSDIDVGRLHGEYFQIGMGPRIQIDPEHAKRQGVRRQPALSGIAPIEKSKSTGGGAKINGVDHQDRIGIRIDGFFQMVLWRHTGIDDNGSPRRRYPLGDHRPNGVITSLPVADSKDADPTLEALCQLIKDRSVFLRPDVS